ncbi:hypothetical protein COV61_03235 [Candidatus Micrarchaeota archaeon CG11_big_fil_rev_8_21_14_0_20_47_5]|nr:MAG: hypothetical protein AUJ17_01910 [Candidatus Micrarchaeota archaeon CG1_02_47_40]PIN83384.1 MAG: hypothetical protein COV61_03235 [Candidatus Micrarchaeota archaeon CG11_big_fil_rev_8_21_14_0_20_47_5]
MEEKTKGMLAILGAVLITLLAFALSTNSSAFYSLGYLGIFLLGVISSATVILPAPGIASLFFLGKFADPLFLGVIFGIGSGIGELTGYMAGRGGNYVIDGKNKEIEKHKKAIRKWGPLAIFFLALIPNPVFDFAGIAAGLVRMPPWQFLLSCCAGKVIKGVALAYAGFAWL